MILRVSFEKTTYKDPPASSKPARRRLFPAAIGLATALRIVAEKILVSHAIEGARGRQLTEYGIAQLAQLPPACGCVPAGPNDKRFGILY